MADTYVERVEDILTGVRPKLVLSSQLRVFRDNPQMLEFLEALQNAQVELVGEVVVEDELQLPDS